MAPNIRFEDVVEAHKERAPHLVDLMCALANQSDEKPENEPPAGTLTFSAYRNEVRYARRFDRMSLDEKRLYRQESLAQIEASDIAGVAPERLRLHQIIRSLWEANDAYSRTQLLAVIRQMPLVMGPWRALKQIFKEAEASADFEIYGALVARFDTAFARGWGYGEVSKRTLGYLVRRAWRHLRQFGQSMPSTYPVIASQVLAHYTDDVRWNDTWVANHIFFHGLGQYKRNKFVLRRTPSSLLKNRAFPDAWQRAPEPLFSLLQLAQTERVREFATGALKADFKTMLRDVDPSWVPRLIHMASPAVDTFVAWLLENVPRFEQAALKDLGLHDAALRLLHSESPKAATWAAGYMLTHARDLALDDVLLLVSSQHAKVREAAAAVLAERDPRDDVGLDAWGRLLGTAYGHDLATTALAKHFSRTELTPAWFHARLRSDDRTVVRFAVDLMPRLHKDKDLDTAFFMGLVDDPEMSRRGHRFAMEHLEKRGPSALSQADARLLFLHHRTEDALISWIDDGKLSAETLGADFLKAVCVPAQFAALDEVKTFLASKPWAEHLRFTESRQDCALRWLGDVRVFAPDALGFEWLLDRVASSDEALHSFAATYMTKAFLPADFAAPSEGAADAVDEAPKDADLEQKSFLFTGKLATMTRSEANKKVVGANGKKASGVNKTLDYLVIGDEGSALYGEGKKGSKQVKAEKLIDAGADLKVISETAFLQMLSGETRSFDEASHEEGAAALWAMLFEDGPEDAPRRRFALQYLRMHHPDICLEETDRFVDPGAEIPATFLTMERIGALLTDKRPALFGFGLELCNWELGRLQPSLDVLLPILEAAPNGAVTLLQRALLADDTEAEKRIRIAPEPHTPAQVFALCEGKSDAVRALGMRLLAAHPRLSEPEALFRLTESPDRHMRAFVVRQLWQLYRARGTTADWTVPTTDDAPDTHMGAAATPAAAPASAEDLRDFLRRTLFGLPPGRDAKERASDAPARRKIPARVAKKALLEVVRDLAIEDRALATLVAPALQEFQGTRGVSESAAVLVALTRLRHAHPDLPAFADAASTETRSQGASA